MTKVFSAHAVSVDGYISGRGDTPSQVFDGFRLSEPSARFFDTIAARVGAAVAGRTTYEHSGHWGGGGPHPTAPLFVLSHRPAPEISTTQTLVTTGIEDAVAAARQAAEGKDVALMGGGVVTSALEADPLDEVILHQVPILLGGGRPFFPPLPEHVRLGLREARPAPGLTHLHYEVVR
jgi:dihydrofolate reductase